MNTFTIRNDQGRQFTVRLVRQGDHYGAVDCLTHDTGRPLVEFYDATHAGSRFGPRGQFVSRYYVDALIPMLCSTDAQTLLLHGAEPSKWVIDAATFRRCMAQVLSACVAPFE